MNLSSVALNSFRTPARLRISPSNHVLRPQYLTSLTARLSSKQKGWFSLRALEGPAVPRSRKTPARHRL